MPVHHRPGQPGLRAAQGAKFVEQILFLLVGHFLPVGQILRLRRSRAAGGNQSRRSLWACAAYAEGKPPIAYLGDRRHDSNCLAMMPREDIFIT